MSAIKVSSADKLADSICAQILEDYGIQNVNLGSHKAQFQTQITEIWLGLTEIPVNNKSRFTNCQWHCAP